MTKKSPWAIVAAITALVLAPLVSVAPPASAVVEAPVHTYRDTPGDVRSDRFTLTANGTDVFVAKYANRFNNRMAVARFASDDATPVLTVTANSPITSWKIHPERNYPASAVTVSGNTLTFQMSDSLRYAIVEINGIQPNLAIVNDPPEDPASIPDPAATNVVNVKDFVTDTTGATDQTSQIAAAVDKLYSDPTKDTLYFPDGWYTHRGIDLHNRTKPVTIYTEEGALLKNRIQPTMEAMEPTIGIWDSANVTFSGRGVFDGNGFANYDTGAGGWRHDAATSQHQGGVMVVRSQNIVFNDTLARDAKQWNWETHTAKNVTFNNIKGLTPYGNPWVDGVNLASGQNITVNGALTLGNDDNFASGHYNPNDKFTADPDRLTWDTADTFGISVKNHLGWTVGAGNGTRIGGGGGYLQRDFTFDNVNYVGTANQGITMGNGTEVTSVTFRNSSWDTSRVNNNFGIAGRGSATSDRLGSLVFDNVWFSKNNPMQVSNTTNLTIHGLTVAGTRVTRATQMSLALTNITNRDFDFVQDVAPVFGAIAGAEVEAGTELVLPIPVSDGDGDTVVVSSNALPAGGTITGNVLHWTPTAAQAGPYDIPLLATDSRGATATGTVHVMVTDPNAERIDVPLAADASVQAWNTEQSQNYGDNELLRLLNFNDSTLGGVLGEKYAGNQSNRDGKLGLLSFDLGALADRVRQGELLSAQLTMTYAGPSKVALTGTNALVVARATPGWVEGNGKTTPTVRTNTVAGAVTWLTKPTIDTSVTATSAPFDVTAAKVGSDSSYSATQKPVGVNVKVNVLPLLNNLPASSSVFSLAVNETKKQDILFVSREGAARNPNAAGMAPRLTLTFKVTPPADTVAPDVSAVTSPAVADGVGGWFVSPVSVSVSASDAGSGVASVEYKLDDGAWSAYSSPVSIPEGVSTVNYRATDQSGNVSDVKQLPVKRDQTAPDVSASTSPAAADGVGGWFVSPVSVSVSASDAGSGVASVEYRLGEGAWGAYSSPVSIPEGTTTFSYRATDEAGNVSAVGQLPVKADATAPVTSVVVSPGSGVVLAGSTVSATFTATDAGSGVASTEYSTDGGATWVAATDAGVSFTEVGQYVVKYRSVDAAGNVEEAKEVTLTVVQPWTFTGFYAPVDMGGVVNVVKGGSTVPLKFELFSGEQELTSTTAIDSLRTVQHSCDPAAPVDEVETVVAGGTALVYDTQAGRFQYNWKTPKSTGCMDVIVRSTDGSELKAQFRLK
ncbi:OmpL47-type beta-barrel domain-containing protein [Microbacterium sp. E-13]|uniref:OmpL47-type beta-barrel domain-containing protein n=1 Tax=Microbacterium sp. E-13 TaxID=3404048 RepID=UPI003CE7FF7E